ncbi:regulator of replication initiation timing [Actinoplanes tereljensis]|uniref:Uncharacterized protein n=1 Tax=Paractinoplanes tereljensis TaxID=571912 RepID=A0A919NMI3_9ACTN|nr:hypothetical protein [Actinoplanes tereljensis]GIF21520.1 hypothetical protein Ate02nite_42500 [Actinoplanes tereljensis]
MDDDLTRLATDIRERELLGSRKAGINAAITGLTQNLDGLRRRHAIEQRDVDRLENYSLTRLLAAVRGSREQALDREKAEAEAARYRVAQAQDRLDALRAQLAQVEARLVATATAPGTYAMLLAQKEKQLVASGAGGRLAELAEQRGRLTAELKELTEAESAARAAAQALTDANEMLESADNWSTADTFLGGGGLSSLVKHSRLDDAAARAAEADRRLAVLRAELRDVNLALPSLARGLELDGFTRFADVWLDNIFTDLSVRGQIKDGLGQLGAAAQQVGKIRSALAARITENRTELALLNQERTALLHP